MNNRHLFMVVIGIMVLLVAFAIFYDHAVASDELYERYVLCQPESFVYVRKYPKMRCEEIGRLELGDMVWTDGKKKNGFMHVYANLETDGWIYSGYLTSEVTKREEQRALKKSKVACRRCIKGKIRTKLNEGDMVTVYAWSKEWAVTDYGFIMTKFIEQEFE